MLCTSAYSKYFRVVCLLELDCHVHFARAGSLSSTSWSTTLTFYRWFRLVEAQALSLTSAGQALALEQMRALQRKMRARKRRMRSTNSLIHSGKY